MKTIDEIRRINLRTLVNELGSVAALARVMQRDSAQISQLLHGTRNAKGKPRGMSNATARRFEENCNKPSGWLDQDHTATTEAPLVQWAKKNGASLSHDCQLKMIDVLNILVSHEKPKSSSFSINS